MCCLVCPIGLDLICLTGKTRPGGGVLLCCITCHLGSRDLGSSFRNTGVNGTFLDFVDMVVVESLRA